MQDYTAAGLLPEAVMAFRELSVQVVKDVLRAWAAGCSQREAARRGQVDVKTGRRYVAAARRLGLERHGAVDDGLVGAVVDAVRPGRSGGYGAARQSCAAERARIAAWLADGVSVTKVGVLLRRRGVVVPYRTLVRFVHDELGGGRRRKQPTVPVDDCAPGQEVQVDFGELGWLHDAASGKRRKVHALVFTAVHSRHLFVWLTFQQTAADVIEGFERAWAHFGGVFHVAVVDNFKAAVRRADPVAPLLSDTMREYAQARDFQVAPARVRRPQDKGRVENGVQYVQRNFWQGEAFKSLAEAQEEAVAWCQQVGLRDHGTTHRQPLAVFEAVERAALKPLPAEPYVVPVWQTAKVQPDQHVQAGKALYSVPPGMLGQKVDVRLDPALCQIYRKGRLVVAHPRQAPGGRSTLAAHFDRDQAAAARRDVPGLVEQARGHGPSVGRFAERLVDDSHATFHAIRQLFRLLGLVRRFGDRAADRACAQLLDLDVPCLRRLQRVLEQAADLRPPGSPPLAAGRERTGNVVALRFARDASHFAVRRSDRALPPDPGGDHAA